MISYRPILHISIYYKGSSITKAVLKKQLSTYIKKLISNPWEPAVGICLDTFDEREEKQIQQQLMYDTVITYNTKHVLTTTKELYTLVILLISLTRQRLYEINPNSRAEDWFLISITPSDADHQSNNHYDIQWSFGQ